MRNGRALLLLVTIVAGARTAALPCFAAETVDAASRSQASMVIVSSHIAAHRDAIGAGVVVAVQRNRIRVITARHVADHGPVTIWIDGRAWAAEIVRTFANRDLAILDAIGGRFDALRIRPAIIAQTTSSGSDLYVWGENETGLRMQRGSVVSTTFKPRDGSVAGALLSIACDSCAPGDSGGGIFDAAGRLLGILTARYHTVDNRTIALVGERIDESIYAITDGPFELSASARRPLTIRRLDRRTAYR